MRLTAYVGASIALAGGVVLKAMHQRSNFYSACVYLSQSNANLMILTNLCLMVVAFFVFGLQRLLYGRLRAIETEQLYEKAWFAVTETCLAMTIFRGEMGGWFVVMFVCLLIGKLWGWIGQGRLEILEQQPPSNPRLFHTRLATSLVLSVMFNAFLLEYSVQTVLRQARPDMMVMFGFEFAVLTILSASTAARYGISLVELYIVTQQKRVKMAERRQQLRAAREEERRQRETTDSDPNPSDDRPEDEIDEMELDVPGWEDKGRWIFYLDLITDFLKLVVYLCFFAILFTFYGLPIHILRDVVLTMKSFVKRILQFMRYRNATRDMNQRYPDATAEEIATEDVCIICREEMHPWQQPGAAANGQSPRTVSERLRPKKLPCGHLLHFACLRSWLERQQICPTCRRPVTPAGGVGRGAQQAGAGPEGLGNAAGPGRQQMAGANQADAGNGQVDGEGRPRAWFLNLGPVRIGVGAGRGDIVRNLVQQMHNGPGGGGGGDGAAAAPPQAEGAPAHDPNANLQQHAEAQQHFGFGFGFGRRPPAAGAAPFNHQNAQLQIQQLEQQIMQEINSLNVAADQLHLVRLLQNELARLRIAQQNQNQNAGTHPATAATATTINREAAPPQTIPTAPQQFASHAVPASSTTQRQFAATSPAPVMNAGDPRLPEGLTLPSGWSLLPLQRLHRQPGQPPQQADHSSTNPASGSNASSPQPAQPDHLTTTSSGRPDASGEAHAESSAPAAGNENPQQSSPPASAAASSISTSNGTNHQQESVDKERGRILENGTTHRDDGVQSNREPEPKDNPSPSPSSSTSKGKARAATVEDAAGE